MVDLVFLVFVAYAGFGREGATAQGGRRASLLVFHGRGWQRSSDLASASSISSGRHGSKRLMSVFSFVVLEGGLQWLDLSVAKMVVVLFVRSREGGRRRVDLAIACGFAAGVAGLEGGGGLGSSPADVAQWRRSRPCEAGRSCGLQSDFAMVRLLSGKWWFSASSSGGSCGGDEGWWRTSVCASSQVSRGLCVISSVCRVLSAGALGQCLRPLSSSLYSRMYAVNVVACLF